MTLSFSLSNQTNNVWRKFSPRSLLPFKQQNLWQINKGVVRTLTWLEDGTIITLGLWGPGDIVGKVLSEVEPYQIECFTHVEATAFSLNGTHSATEILLPHIHQLEELMVIRSYKKIDTMLIKLLGWLAQKYGRAVETGQLIDLRLTHQDIAEMLGSTRVTITRTLSHLEQQGFIQRLPLHRIVLQEAFDWW